MNKKGFTIVEILAAVIILGILSVVIVPSVNEYLEISKDNYNKEVKKQMILSGKNYYSDNTERLPRDRETKSIDYVSVKELSTLKYIDNEFVDADDNSCMDKSYVVAANKGLGVKYYACMICGLDEDKYITEEERFYCDATNVVDLEDIEKDELPVCEVLSDTSYTNDGLMVKIKGTAGEGRYIKDVYVISQEEKSESSMLSEESSQDREVEAEVTFKEYGLNYIYIMDDHYNKALCTTVRYDVPEKVKLEANMYLINKEEYEAHKNKGFSEEEIGSLEEYNGNNWENGYVYVELDYYNFQYDNIKVKIGNNEEITITNDKKYFFIEKEGEIDTVITGIRSNNEGEEKREITTKLDRTAPTVTLTNPSRGNWTNKTVTVTVNAIDSYSGIKNVQYSYNGTTWTTKTTGFKSGSNNNRKTFTISYSSNTERRLYVRTTDKVGIVSASKSTYIRVDKTAPTVTLSSTNNVSKTQTATMTCRDNEGVTRYYQGSSSSPSLGSYISIGSRTSYSKSRSITSSGTTYYACRDAAGNTTTKAGTYYKTSFSVANGSVSPTYVLTLKGNYFSLPTPSANSYYTISRNWYTSTAYTTLVSNYYKPTSNRTLYAKANKIRYTITYVCSKGSTNCPKSTTVEHGNSYKISTTKPSLSGYTFIHWNTSSSGKGTKYNPGSTISSVKSNITLYASVLKPYVNSFTCPSEIKFRYASSFKISTDSVYYYYAIDTSKVSGKEEYYSSNCAIKNSFDVGKNCVNDKWVSPLSNYYINSLDYTSNSTSDKYANKNTKHSIKMRYSITYSGKTIKSNTKSCSYTTK